MSYQVPQHISKDKIFIVNRSEIEGRLEPEFYRPSLSSLENKIRSLATHKLRDYAISLAGGATPKKTEADLFYTDEKNGIPFLRVQNLQTNGELSLAGCIYINEETHNGLLARSQVSEGDLLVKITGVGRMAIASVAPPGFVGNTNQHMVVIKTGDASLSKYLARYLNLDIIEKIASRHSTGGTRPALDYPSLKSLPIIEGIDFSPIDNAIKQKNDNECKAQQLLDSIDTYLLNELGISLQEHHTGLKDRMFVVNFCEANGERLDPMFYTSQFRNIVAKLHENTVCKRLGQIVHFSTEIWNQKDYYEKEFPYIEIGAINIPHGKIEDVSFIPIEQAPSRAKVIVRTGDIIISTTRPDRGAIIKITENENLYIASTGFSVIRNVDNNINPDYLLAVLRHRLILMQMRQRSTGGNYPAITQEELSKIIIPILSLSKQLEIVDHISAIRKQAKVLQEEGKRILESAKQEVERMILQ